MSKTKANDSERTDPPAELEIVAVRVTTRKLGLHNGGRVVMRG